MNLLMITRKIDRDDWLAGHSWEWAEKINSNLKDQKSKLIIICLEKGNISGLETTEIYSLGKELGATRWQRFWRFQKLAARLVNECDGIFCHQNPEYAIAVAPWAKMYHKKIVSWYTHKAVTWKTRAMLAVSDSVLTASKKSFRLSSPKVKIVGHGINTEVFRADESRRVHDIADEFEIVTVGRITPAKDLETLIVALGLLNKNSKEKFLLRVVGRPVMSGDYSYFDSLKKIVSQSNLSGAVKFEGDIPHSKIFEVYQAANLFVNLSQTGSLDKAVLEAMACECPVITSNESFFEMLKPLGEFLITKPNDPKLLAEKILYVKNLGESERESLGRNLRSIVSANHSLDNLSARIVENFKD